MHVRGIVGKQRPIPQEESKPLIVAICVPSKGISV